ncbi:hypothetical protein AA101099_1640 [Neoasaia chiangmaiensis NBRC 101099]|uniref:Organic solvent tolerance-like N-terminal domain-containing protein n=1 Tax=Neoasaia chiangmaiensis TaxID=320497 RepID=A0A1U9KRE7_9PROT|nr:LptA/OstA family protein [Neoasaia chiangmaiensis]AQS88383.1 hypothetical protein A0U93_11000 [Neoasaia chiangmaiensis]GBR39393.1 hypothetical protein AA101099_1640 [Neoasaia chiangmaiensis NBRC 101099]GEN14557.1 hypothetical protein NCH01_09880 [Neoasaia chiangmaiensis]
MSTIGRLPAMAAPLLAVTVAVTTMGARAQGIDLSHGEQVHISSAGPQTYDHDAQTVTFVDRARAVRGDVTIDADQLIGFLRKKAPPPGAPPPKPATADQNGGNDTMGGSMELYRMEAVGHVHIYTPTDQAWGDKALYDIDQATMVMTGKALKLVTPQDVMTARDVMEYHSDTRMSVGRGDATVTTNDGKRVRADVLVAFSKPDDASPKAPANGGDANGAGNGPMGGNTKLDRAYGWGHVLLRTPNETATGDRGVYMFDTQMARLIGHVHVTSGQNQNNGASAIVNMKTGVAIMNPMPGQRIEGLVIPNEANSSKPGGTK